MQKENRQLLKIVLPGLLGNVLEWYDFALYGYFATIISPLFFPNDDRTLSLITTFAVFAIGFIMRPLGAIIFGHLGDKYGRKNSLSAAILLMAIPTTLIGCLPSFQTIGLAAPLLLIVCRLLQGLAVGGEFTGSIIYIIEHATKNRRGFFGACAMSSAFVGLLLGSIAALWVGGYIDRWPNLWRLPFILSLVLGAVGLYLRLGMPESPVFIELQRSKKTIQFPLAHLFKHHLPCMLKAIALVMLPSLGFYMSFVYLSSFMHTHLDINLAHALLINTATMLVIIFILPLFGLLSDKIGRVPILVMGACGFLLLSAPMYYLLQTKESSYIVISQSVFGLLVACSYSVVPVVLCELFAANVRYSGMSLPYNLANALFGGTAPLVAESLIRFFDSLYAPAIYLSAISVVTLLVSVYWGLQTNDDC